MKIALFGYGGHAREVKVQINEDVTFFVDDLYAKDNVMPISKFDPLQYKMMICVAEPEEKENIVKRLPKNTKYFTFIHPSVQILDENIKIGEGSFIGANCILTTNINLGKHTILNRGVHIGHDSIVGDFFSAMPGSIVSGNVTVGKNCYVGTNSTIIEKLNITDYVKIGAGAVVTKNINEKGTYVGVPVYKLK